MTQRAVVVFLGHDLVDGAAWWGRFLKPGFVHCFVLVESRDCWIRIEVRYGMLVVTHAGQFLGGSEGVANYYRAQGAWAIEAAVTGESVRAPLIVRTCVGMVKAVLGIRSLSATPWQLYKHMKRTAT